ncbi:hypothetical protein AWC15_20760 [Mycobacterium lacus]|nr:hypothetical protein AWC15_20760 [Mycobacterium lacus]
MHDVFRTPVEVLCPVGRAGGANSHGTGGAGGDGDGGLSPIGAAHMHCCRYPASAVADQETGPGAVPPVVPRPPWPPLPTNITYQADGVAKPESRTATTGAATV